MLSLETCLKLKEAGFQQLPFEYCWARFYNESEPTCIDSTKASDYLNTSSKIICACPSLEELLEAVQAHIGGELGETKLAHCVNADQWESYAYPHNYMTEEKTIFTVADSPSEAVAALWLKLKAGSE